MFDNIGGKLKSTAKEVYIGVTIVGIVVGIIIMATGLIFNGLLVIAGVALVAYISSLLLYGFGELIEKTCSIESMLRGDNGDKTKE